MKRTAALIILGAISLLPFVLAIVLMTNISKFPCHWLGLTYWGLTSLIVLLAVWIIYYYFLKTVKTSYKHQFEKEKVEKEKELEKFLADKHQEYKLKAMKYDIQRQKLDLEMKKLEKGKKKK